ncbi:hypothetical protein HYALB_00010059 [Hymenoscyphus albidus]|uniref:Uncharacterized protein n=1 Tax=Hymenoscyphus albidus TaxID=595503 RepID=A0A9N9LVY7_9HELO|nr:hypothetical protein HYALB_00010059 [Hymenoscyphus albidus]
MLLLPNLPSNYVQVGLWRNHTAPYYRQYLWTTTNITAIIVLGLLGILVTAAGNRLWPIIRQFLQPSIQLSDLDNRRVKLSRTDAIKSLRAHIKNYMEEFKAIWTEEYGFKNKINSTLAPMRGNTRQPPDLTTVQASIELRFGVFAILNIASFAFLGIMVPFFLAEGLQGEAVVQGYFHRPGHFMSTPREIMDEALYDRANDDFEGCISGELIWSQSTYCVDLRKPLPPYEAEDVNLTEPLFEHPPYRVLRENGDGTLQAIKLSGHTSFQDIAFNAKSGEDTLLHELTCVPVPLDPFVNDFNGASHHFELRIKGFLSQNWQNWKSIWRMDSPPYSQYEYVSDGYLTIHYSMALKTNNSIVSGRQIHNTSGRNEPEGDIVDTNNPHRRTWYQNDIDSTLPLITYRDTDSSFGIWERANKARQAVDTNLLQNFLITIKPQAPRTYRSQPALFKSFSDDSIFGARLANSGNEDFFPDREVSAIGCTETFVRCSSNQCTEINTAYDGKGPGPEWNDLLDNQRSIKSIWIDSMLHPIYALDKFFLSGRRRWQQDIEERFIRALIRARYATKTAAEKFLAANPSTFEKEWPSDGSKPTADLLYLNPDHTNISIWGVVATTVGYLYIIAVSYWTALLSPIGLLVKAIARISGEIRKEFQVSMVLVSHEVQVAMRFIGMCVRTPEPVTATAPERSSAVSMDNLKVRQEDGHPDNPPRAAINPGIEATN